MEVTTPSTTSKDPLPETVGTGREDPSPVKLKSYSWANVAGVIARIAAAVSEIKDSFFIFDSSRIHLSGHPL
jgi:hypothetical protein